MAKKKRAGHHPFESRKPDCPFVKIAQDMMRSPAWSDLNLRQRGFYLTIKSKYTQTVVRGIVVNSNQDDISFTKEEALQIYGDYKTFQKDIKVLIDHGFIRLVRSGYRLRLCNLYGFSDGWTKWTKETQEQ